MPAADAPNASFGSRLYLPFCCWLEPAAGVPSAFQSTILPSLSFLENGAYGMSLN